MGRIMNDDIKALARKAGAYVTFQHLMSNPPKTVEHVELWDKGIEKLAAAVANEVVSMMAADRFDVPDFVLDRITKRFEVSK